MRTLTPSSARVIARRVMPSIQAQHRLVNANFDVPGCLSGRKSVVDGSVWGIAMVKNEEDTIRGVVEHIFCQGVDAVIVANNGSSDATADILSGLQEKYNLFVVEDHLESYYQSTKMSVLSSLARSNGADWIVPFDADELWFARDVTLADRLRSARAPTVLAQIYNVFPTRDDDLGIGDPFERIQGFDHSPHWIPKVAFRSHRFVRVAQGNHAVDRPGGTEPGLFIAHFPWRSLDQLSQKLFQGQQAYKTVRDQSLGMHWRQGGSFDDEYRREVWNHLLDGEPTSELFWSPVGPIERVNIGSWRTWKP